MDLFVSFSACAV